MGIKNSFSVFKSNKEKASSVSAKKKCARKLKFFTPESALSANGESPAVGESCVLLLPLRTLVSYPFTLPFGRKGRMREALSLKFRPVLGDREELLSLVPQVTNQTSNSTDGIAWFVSKGEIEEWETEYGKDFIFWPAPLAFMPDDGKSSLVLCEDESGVCAVWFDGGAPLLYRWMPKAPGAAESMSEQIYSYANSLGRPIESETAVNLDNISLAELNSAASSSRLSERGLDTLNLSTKGADNAKELEKFLSAGFKTVKILSVLGVIFLLMSLLLLIGTYSNRDAFDEAPLQVYKTAFGTDSRNPLRAALRELKLVTGEGAQMTFEQALTNFSAAWKAANPSSAITMDSIRYGAEHTEIQGLADSTSSIESLRNALSKNGFAAKLGDVQQVPGSGLRFSITLMGAK